MKRNLASWDRMMRVLMGIALLYFFVVPPYHLFGALGLIPLVTGLSGYCPIYRLFRMTTCPLSGPDD